MGRNHDNDDDDDHDDGAPSVTADTQRPVLTVQVFPLSHITVGAVWTIRLSGTFGMHDFWDMCAHAEAARLSRLSRPCGIVDRSVSGVLSACRRDTTDTRVLWLVPARRGGISHVT